MSQQGNKRNVADEKSSVIDGGVASDMSIASEWATLAKWHKVPRDGTLVEGDLIQLWLEMSFSTLSVAAIEAALVATIPVWFDTRLMALLTNVDMSEAEYYISELSARSIVVPVAQGGYEFPRIVRQRLLRVWGMPERQTYYVALVEILAEHYLTLADEQKTRLRGSHRTQALACLDRFYPNIQAVWEAARTLGHHSLLYRLASTLDDYHTRRALWAQKILWLKTALFACTSMGQEAKRAEIAHSLGIAYMNLDTGDIEDNFQQALNYYQQALKYFTPRRAPLDYAMVQNNVGNAHLYRGGVRTQNLKKAIVSYKAALHYYSWETAALAYRTIHSNLAFAYSELSGGPGVENLAHAVTSYRAALRVYSIPLGMTPVPELYARLQLGLGAVYAEMSVNPQLLGKRDGNLYAMIACYQEVLKFHTIEVASNMFAEIYIDVAHAYMLLAEKGSRTHLWDALNHYELALLGVDCRQSPHRYAETKVTLGLLYTQLAMDMDSQQAIVYLQQAITSYEDVLPLYSLEAASLEYTKIQGYMGIAYVQLFKGKTAIGDC